MSNALTDLYRLGARLPWWIGLAAAVLSFVAFHGLAVMDFPRTTDRTMALMAGFIKGFAIVGQYVVPAVFAAGSAVSAFKRYFSGG